VPAVIVSHRVVAILVFYHQFFINPNTICTALENINSWKCNQMATIPRKAIKIAAAHLRFPS